MITDLDLAVGLVRDAGRLAAEMRRDGVQATRKTSVSDLVTAADHAAEDLIVSRLKAERPDDGVVAEEGSFRPGQRVWYVDPLDGTYNYAWNLPVWCAAVALTAYDQAVVGAVYHPIADELWSGGADEPACRNGRPVEPLTDRALAESSLAVYLHPTRLPDASVRRPLARAVRGAATVRTFGSGSVELAWVAAGRLGGYVQHDCLPWDWYPGAALVEAAGGRTRIVAFEDHRWYLAGNSQLVDELENALLG